tara:strand:- start:66 stop:596 length:531 start_codon:yes stop_codon:yes gene_type:complete
MKVVDIANEIWMELGSPSTLAIPPIAFWLRSNVGELNSRIAQDFYLDPNDFELKRVYKDKTGTDTIIEISDDEKAILKKMYLIHHYDVKLRESLGAASTDSWVEIESDGTSVRRVNKIQQSQTYQVAKKTEMEDLEKLVHAYKSNCAAPIQVAGDDTTAGDFGGEDTYTIRSRDVI